MLNPRQRYPANADAVCEELGRQRPICAGAGQPVRPDDLAKVVLEPGIARREAHPGGLSMGHRNTI